MSEVNFQSILVENKRNLKFEKEQSSKQKTSQGVDFKNDSLLVSAKTSWDDAKVAENQRDAEKTYATMEREHTDSSVASLLDTYQMQLREQQQARSQSDGLATQMQSVLEQLAAQNEVVGDLETRKTDSEAKISEYVSTLSALNQEKASRVNAHDAQIANLTFEKSSTTFKISMLDTNIQSYEESITSNEMTATSASSEISALRASITEDMTDEQRASVEEQINNLQAQVDSANAAKEQAERNKADAETQKAQAETRLSELNAAIESEKSAKEATIAAYDAQIQEVENQLAQERATLDGIMAELAEAVYVQTGLTLQQASVREKLKEAHLYESSINAMIAITEAQLTAAEKKQSDAVKKEKDASKKHETAEAEKKAQEETYKETEATTKTKYEKKERQTVFMA